MGQISGNVGHVVGTKRVEVINSVRGEDADGVVDGDGSVDDGISVVVRTGGIIDIVELSCGVKEVLSIFDVVVVGTLVVETEGVEFIVEEATTEVAFVTYSVVVRTGGGIVSIDIGISVDVSMGIVVDSTSSVVVKSNDVDVTSVVVKPETITGVLGKVVSIWVEDIRVVISGIEKASVVVKTGGGIV